ncbi:hypothetical protein IFM58399_09855 [Aspergillus lentulus]|uniref:Uncharacterized protein n=1 Tax=Aspergillus lentulus TaxID=293939 RepID=A0AAN6BR35_ASPLE|nr:uncharacterized protein IFM58399_09855 [Aspergillus lentulus]KAF4155482.1 hypothetical protein CNMCM6069_007890 [Aspergillus lentulus]KAF4162251.1 hypothetical protein CNMCM6936_002351 [Aspergillus lentulus]KAF4178980.1 hypothetical protein CNMCM8060_003740 [Aspergillus lentulus]KAF4188529.1 hypothetical protein CNMCM7927_001224 [Aspergillus lentulus]KAF4191182.1 hypothetical protein CNMCM8694_002266 [Aspergillus lentulus]
MATTTTTTQTSTHSLSILADYELHHSGSEEPQLSERGPVSQPAQLANWPSNYRRLPAYRPVNHELDQSERPAGSNLGEFVFIQVMLHGVWLNASVARLWRHTGGRINNQIFRYDIGGEF